MLVEMLAVFLGEPDEATLRLMLERQDAETGFTPC